MKQGNELPEVVVIDEPRKVAEIVLGCATEAMGEEPDPCGCKTFYSPLEWKERGEEYGLESELIVVHDGGDFAHLCSYLYNSPKLQERFIELLEAEGYYIEPCTCWYGAVYKTGE